MPWRRRRTARPARAAAAGAFDPVLEAVAEARDTLLLGVPRGRAALLPLAEALAGFEAGLALARRRLNGWRSPEVEAEWQACRSGLDAAARAAEGLRLRESPRGYEELAPLLDGVLAPLEVFDGVAARHRRHRG